MLSGWAEEERAQWRQPRGWCQGGRSEAGQRRSPALVASLLRQLGSIQSQRVMEELVLLARLDHPTPAREGQEPLTSTKLLAHGCSCITHPAWVHPKQPWGSPKGA